MTKKFAYPTETDLKYFSEALPGLTFFKELRRIWSHDEWGVRWNNNRLKLSTGGWSGNEEIITALRKNIYFWTYWKVSRAGGHYEFVFPKKMVSTDEYWEKMKLVGGRVSEEE